MCARIFLSLHLQKFFIRNKHFQYNKDIHNDTLDYYVHTIIEVVKDQVSASSLNKMLLSSLLRPLERMKSAKRRSDHKSFDLLRHNEEGGQEGSIFLRSSEGLFQGVRGFWGSRGRLDSVSVGSISKWTSIGRGFWRWGRGIMGKSYICSQCLHCTDDRERRCLARGQ